MSPILRPLTPRDASELHRAATPLELLFDLVSVIAIAAAAAGLHHSIIEAHAVQGLITFCMAFGAIWWAWMNYTWFASAYDNDDTLYRLLTIVIMGGSLTMAAGIAPLFKQFDLKLVIVGYVIMRLGMIALWLRAAKHDPKRRKTAYFYALGIGIVQVFWVIYYLMLPMEPIMVYGSYILLLLVEFSVPVVSERNYNTPYHRHHIIERYGLLNIIVLGESLLAGGMALQQLANGSINSDFIVVALASLIIVFSLWWLYFSQEEHLPSDKFSHVFVWGYGHFIIFASGAGVGAGLAVFVDIITGHGKASLMVGEFSVAIPMALYMLGIWIVRDRYHFSGLASLVLPIFSGLILLAPLTPISILGLGVLAASSVVVRNFMRKQ